jgi:hypothetical protein
MTFHLSWRNSESYAEELLNTFRTLLWLGERRWFVQGEYNARSVQIQGYHLTLYLIVLRKTVTKMRKYCSNQHVLMIKIIGRLIMSAKLDM